jgi:hypothetical protein
VHASSQVLLVLRLAHPVSESEPTIERQPNAFEQRCFPGTVSASKEDHGRFVARSAARDQIQNLPS